MYAAAVVTFTHTLSVSYIPRDEKNVIVLYNIVICLLYGAVAVQRLFSSLLVFQNPAREREREELLKIQQERERDELFKFQQQGEGAMAAVDAEEDDEKKKMIHQSEEEDEEEESEENEEGEIETDDGTEGMGESEEEEESEEEGEEEESDIDVEEDESEEEEEEEEESEENEEEEEMKISVRKHPLDKKRRKRVPGSTSASEDEDDEDEDEEMGNAVMRRLLRMPRYFDPDGEHEEHCFNCGGTGHKSRDCPFVRSYQTRTSRSTTLLLCACVFRCPYIHTNELAMNIYAARVVDLLTFIAFD